jgi:hypothetical protein
MPVAQEEEHRWKFYTRTYASLDVHKESVAACVRHMANGKVSTQVQAFKTTTQELIAVSRLAVDGGLYAYWLGSDGRLLQAGLALSIGRRVRVGVGQCGPRQERAGAQS